MELEFCNVYRGTFGKTLPLLQRHSNAVVILWNPNDYDHVFFVTLSQLIPCLKQMKADHWTMIVFWNEGSESRPSTGPDVGLDYTDEPFHCRLQVRHVHRMALATMMISLVLPVIRIGTGTSWQSREEMTLTFRQTEGLPTALDCLASCAFCWHAAAQAKLQRQCEIQLAGNAARTQTPH